MKKILYVVFGTVLFGLSFLGLVSPTSIEKLILVGTQTVKVIVSVGDSVPLANGEEGIVTGIRLAQHIAIRVVGGTSMVVQIRAISLRTLYLRRKKEAEHQEKKKQIQG